MCTGVYRCVQVCSEGNKGDRGGARGGRRYLDTWARYVLLQVHNTCVIGREHIEYQIQEIVNVRFK